MNFYNRPEAKFRAQSSMRGTYPHPAVVTLVYLALTVFLSGFVLGLVNDPFRIAALYMLDGVYELDYIFRMVFRPDRVAIYLVLLTVVKLYQAVMDYGYTSYSLRLARWEQPAYHNLGDGFSRIGRVLLTWLLTSLFVALWSALLSLPAVVLTVMGAALNSWRLLELGSMLFLGGTLLSLSASYRYRLAYFLLLDNPQMSALESIRRSKELMRGRKWMLFVQDLSFIGWRILSVLTFGVLALWAVPYESAANANFYHWVVYGSLPNMPPPPVNGQSPRF